jgi:dihydroxyacetone kinase-like predicted kinase
LQDINIENLQEQSLRYAAESAREHGLIAQNGAVAAAAGGVTTTITAPPEVLDGQPALTGDTAIVAVAAGDGWTKLFKSLGVSVVVPGGQTMNPSTQDLLQAVESCSASKVFLLPNNGNIIMSARQVQDLTTKSVCVIPTDSLPQGVGAVLAFNQMADFEANGAAMERAGKQVQTAEITQAVRAVQLDGINVSEGDIIGLVNNRLVTSGTDLQTVVIETLQRMNAGTFEIITIYYGADISPESAGQMAQYVKERFSAQEIEVVEGGQPFYAYVISAE